MADEAGNLTQAQANTITTKCGAPKRWLEAKVGELKFQVDADGDYDKAACVLKEISRSGATKFGFVGNEVYRADEPK